MTESPWPLYVERVFRCTCGEEIGVCEWPARSVEDGSDLGVAYVALKPGSLSGAVSLWKVGTGDAGYYDQRCPGCDALLVKPKDQGSLF